MGNTCGSCSFDNRGAEFDMEPKDKPPVQILKRDNPPLAAIENENSLVNNVISNQRQIKSSKASSINKQMIFEVEDKENSSIFINQNKGELVIKGNEQKEVRQSINKDLNYEEQYIQNIEDSFDFLEPPQYDCPEVMRIRDESGPFNYELGPYMDEYADGQNRDKRDLTNIENEAKYQGEWLAGTEIRDGRGFQIWPDGSLYEGFWRNNKANGRGRLIHADGDVYEGEWKDDKAHGIGVYCHADGATYEGSWYEDKQHGKGVERWPDGAVYDGNYSQGQKHGQGCFKWSDGSVFTGNFIENNIEGYGIYEWNDGRKFEGQWKDNKMHGEGVFSWADGRSYTGEYVQDMKDGYGVFTWPDGRKYEGYWKQGKQDGQGTYHTANGKMRKGEWLNGKRIRWLK